MIQTQKQKNSQFISGMVVFCGLMYIFAYQFAWPFAADMFLYGMLGTLLINAAYNANLMLAPQVGIFVLVDLAAALGLLYTTRPTEGQREVILFTFFTVLMFLSYTNASFIRLFTKWIYIASVIVIVSSVVHFLIPDQFNDWMGRLLNSTAYEQLMKSYDVDDTFAGLAAYTPNTTFSAAIVFGHSFLNLAGRNTHPLIKRKDINILLMVLAMAAIILCSKRGIFLATIAAMLVLVFYLYRGERLLARILALSVFSLVALIVLYRVSPFVATFLDRFTGEDITTGRGEILDTLFTSFKETNMAIGWGTGSTYAVADKGAHNIYVQILYEHGVLLSLPYYVFLIYNYIIAFRNHCPLSIFLQTMFLVYGLSGNPLYSNMFMIIYIYHVLYAVNMPVYEKEAAQVATFEEQKAQTKCRYIR